ncbi:hypothetical protein LIER_42799 [Lithospermum erythrorhizon]|uniref:Uncharacterized protein n=1 Tax=Lithospermum erythrorhizon TaxID=34254 RepID=A0AAV3P2N4_LITER
METTKRTLETPPPQQQPEEAFQEQPHQESVHAFQNDVEKPITSSSSSYALDNFKKLLMNVASACAKTNPLSSTQTSLLQHHLDHLLPRFSTPDHPPYAAVNSFFLPSNTLLLYFMVALI